MPINVLPLSFFYYGLPNTHHFTDKQKLHKKTNFLSPLKFEQLCICFTILYRVMERENIGADGDYK